MSKHTDRRTFLKTSLSTLAGVSVLGAKHLDHLQIPGEMPVRALGRTGHQVPLFSLGGQATVERPGNDAAADAIINRALDLGVNYIDTAASYGDGISETYIGRVMKTRRDEVYLATKTHDRTYDGSMRLLERSLENLQTDHLDAWQLHRVGSMDDLDRIFAEDGAIKALEQARAEGVVRNLGITGHTASHVLAEGLRRYDFDQILMALNAADRHHDSFIEKLLPLAVEKNIGIIGMKIPARGRLFREGGITQMEEAMRYVLSFPVSTVIVGVDDVEQLEENIDIARRFEPMSDRELAAAEAKTQAYSEEAQFFKLLW